VSRFPGLEPADMDEAQRRVYESIASGPRGGVRGPFVALLHNPELAERIQRLGEHLRYRTAIPSDLLELAILVTSRRWTCQFEWYAHSRLAQKAGLPDAIIDEVAAGRRPSGMTADQALVHDFAAALHDGAHVTDAVFDPVASRFGRAGALDLVALCGYYALLAMVLNVAQTPLPAGAAPVPGWD
jgi:4-carboxymuconolactone decarboxylase